jgi:glycosyltransferase involved in cell wall biosynthesis
MICTYSVIIPIKDEADAIGPLLEELYPVMQGTGERFEILCIDDGSSDGSLQVLQRYQSSTPELRVLQFDRNYGQSSAFDAGFKHAKGKWLISLDGDGQNDPRDIPRLLEKRYEAELICGKRQGRQDTPFKRLISRIANFVRSRACGDGAEDTGCSLKVYNAHALAQIKLFDGMHRFLPALFVIEGFRVSNVAVSHRARKAGQSKYSLRNRNLNTVVDMLAVRWMRKRRLRYSLISAEPPRL